MITNEARYWLDVNTSMYIMYFGYHPDSQEAITCYNNLISLVESGLYARVGLRPTLYFVTYNSEIGTGLTDEQAKQLVYHWLAYHVRSSPKLALIDPLPTYEDFCRYIDTVQTLFSKEIIDTTQK